MKSNYTALWLLLALALLIVVGVSFYDGDLRLGNYTLKKAPAKATLFPEKNVTVDSLASVADSVAIVQDEQAENPEETDTLHKTILINFMQTVNLFFMKF